MKGLITFRKYYRQAGKICLVIVFALGAKFLMIAEAGGTAEKICLFPPPQVAADLQKKPDHGRIGVSAECFGFLPASKEKWFKGSFGTLGETHTFILLPLFVPEGVQGVIIPIGHAVPIYILHCCYRI